VAGASTVKTRDRVLELLKARLFVATRVVERELGLSPAMARYHLTALVDAGDVIPLGETRARVWMVAEEYWRVARLVARPERSHAC
jgi:predicted ArsR family transcriptional regulator